MFCVRFINVAKFEPDVERFDESVATVIPAEFVILNVYEEAPVGAIQFTVNPALVIAEEFRIVGGPVRGYAENLADGIEPNELIAVIIKSFETPGSRPEKVADLSIIPLSEEGVTGTEFNE